MARTYRSERSLASGRGKAAREALRKASIAFAESECASHLRSIAGVVRRADKSIRREKTRLFERYSEQY